MSFDAPMTKSIAHQANYSVPVFYFPLSNNLMIIRKIYL